MGRNDMVEVDNLIKREKRSDNIKHLFDTMDEFSNRQEYEKSKEILDKIKEVILKSKISIPSAEPKAEKKMKSSLGAESKK